jgi:hypothetical protein
MKVGDMVVYRSGQYLRRYRIDSIGKYGHVYIVEVDSDGVEIDGICCMRKQTELLKIDP